VYRSIKDHFKVGSYKQVPADRFNDLVAFLSGGPVEKHATEKTNSEALLEKAFELIKDYQSELAYLRHGRDRQFPPIGSPDNPIVMESRDKELFDSARFVTGGCI
jgi:hypothetical protein